MSVAEGKSRSSIEKSIKLNLWKLFPHVFLILSLVGYAALGAVLFWYIEGGRVYKTEREYREFLGELVRTIQNYPGKVKYQIDS